MRKARQVVSWKVRSRGLLPSLPLAVGEGKEGGEGRGGRGTRARTRTNRKATRQVWDLEMKNGGSRYPFRFSEFLRCCPIGRGREEREVTRGQSRMCVGCLMERQNE